MKVIVLASGGMDSTVALYEAHIQHEVVGALSFNYGSKHNEREIPFAKWHCEQLQIAHRMAALDFMPRLIKSSLMKFGGTIPDGHYHEDTMKQTVVPFRNGIMLSIAAAYAESINAQGLIIAAHAGDHAIYPDCREEFMQAMNAAIKEGTYAGVQLLRPFIHLTKAQIVKRGDELGVDFAKTWSCYKGGGVHCGTCGTCVERREAFILAKLPDPTVYASTAPLPPRPGAKEAP
jgi:7-cyano-7-deazaguanine synthase